MDNNILKKIAYSIIIAIIICSSTIAIYATSTTDLQNQKSVVQDKIEETSSEINGVQAQMTQALNEVNRLNGEISTCEEKITELEYQIQDLGTQIEEKKKNIEEQQAKYDEQQRLLEKRLVAVYESGNTTYLDVLLSSSSLSDFISKYYLLEKLSKYDTELLQGIQDLKNQIETEKTNLETSKQEVEAAKRTVEIQKESIQRLANQKQTVVSTLSAEEKKLQVQLDDLEKDKRDIQKEIAQAEAKRREEEAERAKANAKANASNSSNSSSNNSSSSSQNGGSSNSSTNTPSSPSASGFICPLAGRNKHDITTGFYGYARHGGCDFARNSKGSVQGLPVLASKSGTVMKSTAAMRNGNYISYGEHIMINHGDGTYTLYAHMAPGSRKVEKGDKVSQGQQIGNVGTTGNSSGYHLHFEIHIGATKVDPAQYLP